MKQELSGHQIGPTKPLASQGPGAIGPVGISIIKKVQWWSREEPQNTHTRKSRLLWSPYVSLSLIEMKNFQVPKH